MKYAIFKTKWGFFGLLVCQNRLIRASLPLNTAQHTKKYLLVGINSETEKDNSLFPELQNDITNYYRGSCVDFQKSASKIIQLEGSEFTQKILLACMTVKFAQTISYGKLAELAGFRNAARAAGSVLAKNPLPLIIPCHRIIRADGDIGRFSAAGGAKTKIKMLQHEKSKIM